MELTKIGDKKTLYSYYEDRIVETEAVCVGFVENGEPVWYFVQMQRATLEHTHFYTVLGYSHGWFETPEEAFDYMKLLSELQRVQRLHLDAKIEAAEQNWLEREE